MATNLEKTEQLAEASDRVTLLLETAGILEHELDDPLEAFSLVLRAFWEIPTREKTIEQLERLADLTDQWPSVYATATDALQKTPGRTAQILLLLRIGKWCASKLEQLDHAFGYFTQVLQMDPANLEAYRNIADLYGTSQQWSELASALAVAASNCQDPDETKQFLFIRGRVLEQHVEDPEEAGAAYESACEIDPGYRNALNALDALYDRENKWWQLLTVLDRKLDIAADDDEKLELLMRKGQLLSTKADNHEGAVDTYNDALRLSERYLPALEALENTYRAADQLTKVRDVLEQQIEAAPDDVKRLERLATLAKMLEETLWEPVRAVSTWERVLEIAPKDRDALDALIRIHRKRNSFEELAQALEKTIEARGDDGDVDQWRLELGHLLVGELERPEKAQKWFAEVLESKPNHLGALEGLADAQQMAREWQAAQSTLTQLLALLDDDEAKAAVNFRLGSLKASEQDLPGEAIEYFARVIENDPHHREALRALCDLYLKTQDLGAAAEVLQTEYELEESPKKKAAIGAELGKISQRRGMEEHARRWFEQALAIDPFNAPAAGQMAAIHLAEGTFDQAVEQLEMLIRTEAYDDPGEQQNCLVNLARAYLALEKTDKAVEAAEKAHQLDPAHHASLRALGDGLFGAKRWEEALTVYQKLVKEQDDSGGEDRAELFFRKAWIFYHLKKSGRAISSLTEALSLSPVHRPSLELIIKIFSEKKKYADVIIYQRQLAGCLEGEQRFELTVQMGDLATEKLDDHPMAIQAYEEAIKLEPKDRPTLHKLLPHYQATEQWPEVVDVISRILETQPDPLGSARLHKSAGIIYRDKLDDKERSVECFNAALDANPDDHDVFVTLVELLSAAEDWENLERNYRRMLERVRGGRKDRGAELWHALGELFFYQNKDFSSAIEAFKAADALEPHNPRREELLASCYFNLPDRAEDAIAEYRKLVKEDPKNPDHYRFLGNLFSQTSRLDEAWNVSAALVAQAKANSKEQGFYLGRRPKNFSHSTSHLTQEQWRAQIAHPDDDPLIAKIFSVITPAFILKMEQPLKAYGLKKRNKVTFEDDSQVASIYYRAAQLLGLTFVPELYIKPADSAPFSYALSDPPASVVGKSFVDMHAPGELLFAITKHLAYNRPGRQIRWIISAKGELKMVLVAAMKICVPSLEMPERKQSVVDTYIGSLTQILSHEQIDDLREAAITLAHREELPSIRRWTAGLEHTACRAALLLGGDSCETIQLTKDHHFDANASALAADLLAFGVSKEYAELRQALGLGVEKIAP